MLLSNRLYGRVRGALQLTPADELNLTVPLIDQGVDSLSAVTVGAWFS
jgi:hybrid polyketide synthase/nonribosomal peptide synthetase ACE1